MNAVSLKTTTIPLKFSIEENPKLVSKEALQNIMGHFPAGGSFK